MPRKCGPHLLIRRINRGKLLTTVSEYELFNIAIVIRSSRRVGFDTL
jgi:hypothetical protein